MTVIAEVATALTMSLRITEKIYELIAVVPQAKDLLELTQRTRTKLEQTGLLLRNKADLFSAIEKSMISEAIQGTKKAIENVAKIVEPARADLDVTGGIRFFTRMQFIFRDSGQIPTSLQMLTIANNDLNMVITTLGAKDGIRDVQSDGTVRFDGRPPPPYQERDLLQDSWQRNTRRRGSRLSMISTLDQPDADFSGEPNAVKGVVETPADSELPGEMKGKILPQKTDDFMLKRQEQGG
ncbi:hypothetical protein LTR17_023737 [Elasticomyces elasticus]|nr:hypothetical protein LTR17_023737 [Elasticomyces elasticus]